MFRKWMSLSTTIVALSGLSGCCSFWERHCAPTSYAQPAYAQPAPACCQPCAPACAPAGYPQAGGWTSPAARVAPNCCP
jgi:hypothetical protein